MKWILISIFSGLTVVGIVQKNHPDNKTVQMKNSDDSFAVLELFTSEGCSSCPPADRLLPQLAGLGSNVIPLSFHVDYWDNLGWRDPFSSSKFSARQNEYGRRFRLESIYTPQLVINGEYELVGSNRPVAEADIKKSLTQNSVVKLTIDDVKKNQDKLSVSCHLSGNWQKSNMVAAIVQKYAEMNVKGGENNGVKLSHTNVVREFIEQPATEKMNFEISVPREISNGDLPAGRQGWQLVIYTQQNADLKITGAAIYKP